jgi:hypothetical protein
VQTKFSIEVIVDYRDKTKLPAVATMVKRATARLNAGAQLLSDGQQVQVRCYSDDFFTSKVELEYLFEEIVEQEAQAKPADAPSDEFLAALKGDK